jgi:hypothetical protein
MVEIRVVLKANPIVTWNTLGTGDYRSTEFWIGDDRIIIFGESEDWEHVMRELCGPAIQLDRETEEADRISQGEQL